VTPELKGALRRLLDLFEMDSGEYPHMGVYAQGDYVFGGVTDELAEVLTDILTEFDNLKE
jgi:hypothetical protein